MARWARWLGVAALAACRPPPNPVIPPPPPPAAPTVAPVVVSPAPPAPLLAPEGCPPPPTAKKPPFHLSVIDRYALSLFGKGPRLQPICNDLGVATRTEGFKLFSTATRAFVGHPIATDAGVELLPSGALASWTFRGAVATHVRASGAQIWSLPARDVSRVSIAGDLLVQERGRTCEAWCAIVALRSTDGAQAWRRPCPCAGFQFEMYRDIVAVDGVLLAERADDTIEAWNPSDGRTSWEQPPSPGETLSVKGRFVIRHDDLPITRIRITDTAGHDLATFAPPKGQARLEAIAADRDTVFVATSDTTEYGGRAHVAITGYDPVTKTETFHARMRSLADGNAPLVIERHYASTPPSLWLDPGVVYFHDPDTGLLSAFDRANGNEISTLGVARRELVRTTSGFATIAEDEGSVVVIAPSDVEAPPTERITIDGVFRLDGKPKRAELVVGNVPVTSGLDGRFHATVRARGRIGIYARQPTSATSTAAWADASAVVVPDGRKGPYSATIDAKKDTLD